MDERPDDLTEGWPDEPTNEELARFAEGLRASRPALSHEALGRVEAAMRREMAARPKARRRRWATLAASLAAFALSLLGVFTLGVPGTVNTLAANVGREGLLDAFFKGMLATLLATAVFTVVNLDGQPIAVATNLLEAMCSAKTIPPGTAFFRTVSRLA